MRVPVHVAGIDDGKLASPPFKAIPTVLIGRTCMTHRRSDDWPMTGAWLRFAYIPRVPGMRRTIAAFTILDETFVSATQVSLAYSLQTTSS